MECILLGKRNNLVGQGKVVASVAQFGQGGQKWTLAARAPHDQLHPLWDATE